MSGLSAWDMKRKTDVMDFLISILLTLIILFPMNAFAAEGIQDGTELKDGFALIRGGTYMAKTEVSQEKEPLP